MTSFKPERRPLPTSGLCTAVQRATVCRLATCSQSSLTKIRPSVFKSLMVSSYPWNALVKSIIRSRLHPEMFSADCPMYLWSKVLSRRFSVANMGTKMTTSALELNDTRCLVINGTTVPFSFTARSGKYAVDLTPVESAQTLAYPMRPFHLTSFTCSAWSLRIHSHQGRCRSLTRTGPSTLLAFWET